MRFLILLFISGCTRHLAANRAVIVPDLARPIIADFQSDSISYGRPIVIDNLEIVFVSNFTPLHLGQCTMNVTPKIEINIDYAEYPDLLKRILYHELGHCILNRSHDNRVFHDHPVSLMNAIIVDGVNWSQHKKYYINELFNPGG